MVGEAIGGETMENPFPSLSWKHMDVSFFLSFFQVSTHYENFVIFLDSESEGLLARGRVVQRGKIKMTAEQQKPM